MPVHDSLGLGILVVDGNPHTRSRVEELVVGAGHRVTAVPAFEEAWQLMARERPALLLTVVRLGRFNGFHLALRARFSYPDLPIIVLAEPSERSLAVDVVQLGARFVLNDDQAPLVIPATIAELIARDSSS